MLLAGREKEDKRRREIDGFRNDGNYGDWDEQYRYDHPHENMPENHRGGEYNIVRDGSRRYDTSRFGRVYNMDGMPDIESAFTDRRGRRHYDNGRFAPMGYYPPIPMENVVRQYPYRKIDAAAQRWPEPYRDTNMGFMNHKGYEFEMDGRAGDMKGYAKGHLIPFEERHGKKHEHEKAEPLTERTAMEWAENMENADGTKGPHWNMEQTNKIMKEKGIECDEIDFWLALNATYSDLCKEFKKYGIDNTDAYVDFALAFWLCDEDSVDDKLSAYYEYVVKH